MITDFFLKMDGVKGESQDATHKEQIDIESFSWGEQSPTTIGSATSGAGAGKVRFDSFVFTALVSQASPTLALMCANGTHAPTAVLTARKAGGKQEAYYRVTFKTVFITAYKSIGVGTDLIPRDEVTCVFGEYEIDYRPQLKDGGLGASIKTGWNQMTNKKV